MSVLVPLGSQIVVYQELWLVFLPSLLGRPMRRTPNHDTIRIIARNAGKKPRPSLFLAPVRSDFPGGDHLGAERIVSRRRDIERIRVARVIGVRQRLD